MTLFKSVLVTLAIVFGVWLLVIFQPTPSETSMAQTIEQETRSEPAKIQVQRTELIEIPKAISGITKTIKLTQVPDLWTEFLQSPIFISTFTGAPMKVYVTYQHLNSNKTEGTVTIGFDAARVRTPTTSVSLPNGSEFKELLPKGKYSSAQLSQGWNKINYYSSVNMVLEINDIGSNGNLKSTQLFVDYQ